MSAIDGAYTRASGRDAVPRVSLLRLEGLRKTFGGLVAINDLAFELEAGKIVALANKETLVVAGPLLICPLTIDGVVGPKPVPYRRMVSPGAAGVVEPGYNEVGPSKLPSAWVAAMDLPLKVKNAGANCAICAELAGHGAW